MQVRFLACFFFRYSGKYGKCRILLLIFKCNFEFLIFAQKPLLLRYFLDISLILTKHQLIKMFISMLISLFFYFLCTTFVFCGLIYVLPKLLCDMQQRKEILAFYKEDLTINTEIKDCFDNFGAICYLLSQNSRKTLLSLGSLSLLMSFKFPIIFYIIAEISLKIFIIQPENIFFIYLLAFTSTLFIFVLLSKKLNSLLKTYAYIIFYKEIHKEIGALLSKKQNR